jgi:tRNA(Ile)-lysidine synthase
VSAADAAAISPAEAARLFRDFENLPILIIAVSGGPDSTALMLLLARWRDSRKRSPKLVAVTVDHGLRPEARREANDVKRLARKLDIDHRTLRWTGDKPKAGLPEAARKVRYRLLADAARKAGARHVLTAHTLDDQAETVLFRMARGSGVSGLAGMGISTAMPIEEGRDILLVRPLLGTSKSRLIATLKAAKMSAADDPTNRDPRFTRSRIRALMPALAREGLTAERFGALAGRAERVERALVAAVNDAQSRLCPGEWPRNGPVTMGVQAFAKLPEEIALRLLGRAVAWTGDEGPVELGKLEALMAAMPAPLSVARHKGSHLSRFRRTLAGAIVTLTGDRLTIERAPARAVKGRARRTLTTRSDDARGVPERR